MANFKKSLFAIALAFLFAFGLNAGAVHAETTVPSEEGIENNEATENTETTENTDVIDTSKSKTATNLDENYESTVTISIPSAEKENYTDVVFVLDKSTSDDNEQAILSELSKLKEQVKNSNATVKVGIVIFNKVANVVLPLTELNDSNYSTIEEAIKTVKKSGTNLHAGILAGNKMLAEDTDCDNDRKHLVIVSDGITYIYNEEGDATYTSHEAGNVFASPDDWNQSSIPNDYSEWNSYMNEVKGQIDSEEDNNDVLYESPKDISSINPSFIVDYKDKTRANTVDKALYYSYEALLDAIDSSHVYVIPHASGKNDTYHPWGLKFMQFLANLTGNAGYDYSDITRSIYYFVDAGSILVDEIGSGEDYNFDFVNDINKLHLYVNGEELSVSKVDDNTYSFGDDRYVLTYYADGYTKDDTKYNECYVLEINEAISIVNTVELKYNVQLTNPKTEAGTYGEYDANGENGYESLLTNNVAVLYPVDTKGNALEPEEFPKPTVSYTVSEKTDETTSEDDNVTVVSTDKGNEIAVPKTGVNESALPIIILVFCSILLERVIRKQTS